MKHLNQKSVSVYRHCTEARTATVVDFFFFNSPVWNIYGVWWTGFFFSSLNWIFLPTVLYKIQVHHTLYFKPENFKNHRGSGKSRALKISYPKWAFVNLLAVEVVLAIVVGYYTAVLGAKEQKICTVYFLHFVKKVMLARFLWFTAYVSGNNLKGLKPSLSMKILSINNFTTKHLKIWLRAKSFFSL